MFTIRTIPAVLTTALLLGGCAVGVTHQYDNVTPAIQTSGKTSIFSLAVQDQRPYVVNGQKPQTFVGLSRGGFGNPFDVNTASGKALTDDISSVVAGALAKNGAKVDVIKVAPQDQERAVVNSLAAKKAKAVLISIAEWKSDTYMTVSLHYDVTVSVIDADGRIAAKKRLQGTDELGSSGINPPELSRQVVPPAFKRKVEQLFAAPEVAAQL